MRLGIILRRLLTRLNKVEPPNIVVGINDNQLCESPSVAVTYEAILQTQYGGALEKSEDLSLPRVSRKTNLTYT